VLVPITSIRNSHRESAALTGSGQDRLQASLGGAYVIERELGRGGMATVYLARDAKHQRPVALKVLEPDLAISLGPERFRREIAIVAKLQHPHILAVYDSGETADGQLWFTMPYVEGESLRARLLREGQLPVSDVVRITREIAGALDYAHEAGVIHRDVKPENILLTKRGDALLADFGIARAVAEGAASTDEHRAGLTGTGLAVGTPQYMSPEQAAGERTIDARSDVFALGAVCYEMLAGEPPFTGRSQQAVIAKMMSTDAPSVRVLRPGVSASLDSVIARALARVPADRWASARELAAALDAAERGTQQSGVVAPAAGTATAHPTSPPRRPSRIAPMSLGAGFLIGIALLYAYASRNRSAVPSPSGGIRLAVLPFENEGDSADGYFADGMTDAVHDKLTNVPGLEVIGSASSRQYRGTRKTPQQIGKELGVRYLVEGRIQWAKGAGGSSRVRVHPELVDVESSADKWAQPFDAPLTDVFQVQGDIASKVATALQVALTPAARQTLAATPTTDLVAYDSYLRGVAMELSDGSPATRHRAITAYRAAVARDSTFALAWSALGRGYAWLYGTSTPTPALADSADRATARALALQPGLADADAARAFFLFVVRNDNAHALEVVKAGLARSQTVTLLATAANIEQSLGQWDAAAAHAAEAVKLDPRDPSTYASAANIALWRRDTAATRKFSEKAIAIAPGNLEDIERRMMVDLQQGNVEAARKRVQLAGAAVDPSALVAYVANFFDLGWSLDSAHDRLLLSLSPAAFDGDSAIWAFVRAQEYYVNGDQAAMRTAATIAVRAFDAQLKGAPNNVQRMLARGVALAYLGRYAEAVRSGERGLAIRPPGSDAVFGPYDEHMMARIYVLAGQNEKAMDILEGLFARPYYVTKEWLRVDPNFRALRGEARFERLVAGGGKVAS
jgi:TolB-like protein/tRNA A-37 threonylcarbamoyl transferase component Bud32/tetratricopeptide (TPR) repeat protein